MTHTLSLELRVARRLRAIAESEGVDFAITEVDPDDEDYSQEDAMVRALDRFQLEHPELMHEIREWYLATYPPIREPFVRTSPPYATEIAFSRDRYYLGIWLQRHRPFYEIAQDDDNVGEHS